jgi:hypothetical protein
MVVEIDNFVMVVLAHFGKNKGIIDVFGVLYLFIKVSNFTGFKVEA